MSVLSNTEKATKALIAAQTGLSKAVDLFAANALENEAVLESVAVAKQELEAIGEETDIAVRKAKIDLDLRTQENEDAVLTGLLGDRGLVSIAEDELTDLQSRASNADFDNKAEVAKAVKAAVATATQEAKIAATQVDAAHAVESANLTANTTALQNEIAFLKRSIATLEENAKAEREARVQEAEARAKATGVTVNTSK